MTILMHSHSTIVLRIVISVFPHTVVFARRVSFRCRYNETIRRLLVWRARHHVAITFRLLFVFHSFICIHLAFNIVEDMKIKDIYNVKD